MKTLKRSITAAVSLAALCFAPAAQAAPVHAKLPDPIGAFSLNKACGTAVDSRGDIYVASAGTGKVEVFDPTGTHLASVAEANTPCGLAVDTNGNLFIAETATGNVVKVAPNAYPLTGSPSYGAPVTVDASGEAQGIAVDPVDNLLYVAKGGQVDAYKPDGSPAATIGSGDLTEATGVAAYTSPGGNRYVMVADAGSDEVKIFVGFGVTSLTLSNTIDGAEAPTGAFEFGSAGASLGSDPSNGHFFVYDAGHGVVDEFEASGQFFSQLESSQFADAGPTGIAAFPQLDESQTLVVSAIGGTYTLSFEGEITSPLGFSSTAAAIQAALEALPAIGPGGVRVTGDFSPGGADGRYGIVFGGPLAGTDLPTLIPDSSGLSGGEGAVVTPVANGSGPGRVYVSAGDAAGARLLAFGPVAPPSRTPLPALSKHSTGSCGVAVDTEGNYYLTSGASIKVYDASGTLLTTIADPNSPCDIAVDSVGVVYVHDRYTNQSDDDKVRSFTPSSFPPSAATTYGPAQVIIQSGEEIPSSGGKILGELQGISVNQVNDHLFVNSGREIVELDSAAAGSGVLNPAFGAGLLDESNRPLVKNVRDTDVYAATGEVYVAVHGEGRARVDVYNAAGTQRLRRLVGGVPGEFGPDSVAVDQSNGHVAVDSASSGGGLVDFEASGAVLDLIGGFDSSFASSKIAIDNSAGPNAGNLYAAYQDDLSVFGPLGYGEPPRVVTGLAEGVGGESAAVNGTVDPRDFAVTACRFEYVTDQQYLADGETFVSALSSPCAETEGEIGSETGAVPVHADLNGLAPETRYRFRLVAENEFGSMPGSASIFGPPVVNDEAAIGIDYTEATLTAELDPSGLATTYRFEYVADSAFQVSGWSNAEAVPDPEGAVDAESGAASLQAPIFGLSPETTYRFRLIASNSAGVTTGGDLTFTTPAHGPQGGCPNEEFRVGPSANLPDCRAYELVTPVDTNAAGPSFNICPVCGGFFSRPVRADGASVLFKLNNALPGFPGAGDGGDLYSAVRGPTGWLTEFSGTTGPDGGGDFGAASEDHQYITFQIGKAGELADYLRTTDGTFVRIGVGSLAADPHAVPRYVSAGGRHVIFTSDQRLEPAAAESVGPEKAFVIDPNTQIARVGSIYDLTPGGLKVVSLLPGDATPGPGTTTYLRDVSADGAAVVFNVDGTLYVRRGDETVPVVSAPAAKEVEYDGISSDGSKVTYVKGGDLFSFDLDDLSTAELPVGDVEVTNVSADGSHVYFVSRTLLDGSNGTSGQPNLYVWDGGSVRFIATLVASDIDPNEPTNLVKWKSIFAWAGQGGGPAVNADASRTTPDGSVFVFESRANLAAYDSGGHTEIYRYDTRVDPAEALRCVSCGPPGAPATSDAFFQRTRYPEIGPVGDGGIVSNLTEDGSAVYFQTRDSLVHGDLDGRQDVYEWKSGRLSLISSGHHPESDDWLYGVSADGSDVFITSSQALVPVKRDATPAIFDARVNGGFASQHPAAETACSEEGCQGEPSPPPVEPGIGSAAFSGPGNVKAGPGRKRCGKHKRLRHGRCVKKSTKAKRHHKSHRRAHRNQGGSK